MSTVLSRSRGWQDDDRARNRELARQADAFERMAAAFEEIAGALARIAERSEEPVLLDEPSAERSGLSVEVPYRREKHEPDKPDGQTGPDDADIRDFS